MASPADDSYLPAAIQVATELLADVRKQGRKRKPRAQIVRTPSSHHSDDSSEPPLPHSPPLAKQRTSSGPLVSLQRKAPRSGSQPQKAHSRRHSTLRGLTWDTRDRCWRVRISFQGRQLHVGRFRSEIEAARAYDEAAVKLFGDSAIINFSCVDKERRLDEGVGSPAAQPSSSPTPEACEAPDAGPTARQQAQQRDPQATRAAWPPKQEGALAMPSLGEALAAPSSSLGYAGWPQRSVSAQLAVPDLPHPLHGILDVLAPPPALMLPPSMPAASGTSSLSPGAPQRRRSSDTSSMYTHGDAPSSQMLGRWSPQEQSVQQQVPSPVGPHLMARQPAHVATALPPHRQLLLQPEPRWQRPLQPVHMLHGAASGSPPTAPHLSCGPLPVPLLAPPFDAMHALPAPTPTPDSPHGPAYDFWASQVEVELLEELATALANGSLATEPSEQMAAAQLLAALPSAPPPPWMAASAGGDAPAHGVRAPEPAAARLRAAASAAAAGRAPGGHKMQLMSWQEGYRKLQLTLEVVDCPQPCPPRAPQFGSAAPMSAAPRHCAPRGGIPPAPGTRQGCFGAFPIAALP